MNKFASGMGMGMVAGACVGLALMGMMTDAEKRRMKRSAVRTIRKAQDLAAGMGLMKCQNGTPDGVPHFRRVNNKYKCRCVSGNCLRWD